jgi:hypothetical protein
MPADQTDTQTPRHAGLLRREARRLAQTDRLRANTCSPWEASAGGLVLWLVWRALFKGFRPAWLIASLAVTLWFGAQIIIECGGISALFPARPPLETRIQTALAASVPAGEAAEDYWVGQMSQALDGDFRRRADMDRFRAWASIGPDLIGRDTLALVAIAGHDGAAALDARLRAGPPWAREQQLSRAYAGMLHRAGREGREPPELIFAPDALVQRQAAAQFYWSIAETSAEAFFRGRQSGQFELTMVPGLVVAPGGDTRLYGGMRQLVMQACALTPEIEGCEASLIPPQAFDRVRYALAALEAGTVHLSLPPSAVHDGAQILQAAREAGRLRPAMEAQLTRWVDAILPPEAITGVVVQAGVRADLMFAAPGQAGPVLRGQLDRHSGPEAAELTRLLEDLALIRRTTTIMTAIRLVSAIDQLNQADYLVRIANTAGDRLLGLHLALGEGVYSLLDPVARGPAPSGRNINGAYAGLLSVIAVLFLTCLRLLSAPAVRRASRMNALDARLSSLFLGRKT